MHRISVCLASFLSLACLALPVSAYELVVQNGVNVWSPTPLPPRPLVQPASLVQVQVNVKQIAEAAGFQNEKSFIRAFKSWTGSSPDAFRRQRITAP